MATELDALQLNFTASTSGADKSLQKLIATLKGVGESIGAVNSQGFTANIENLASTLNNLEFAVNNVATDKIKSISSGIKSLANSVSMVGNDGNVGQVFRDIASGIDALGTVSNTDFSNISVLANGISKLGGGTGTQAGANLIPIAEGLKAFQGINIPQLEGITEFANGLRALGSKTIVNASSALKPIADALRQFPTEIPAISGLTELAQSLSLFGRKTAQQAVETIPRLAKAFKELIVELSSAPSVSRNLVNLTDALARFVTNVTRVGSGSVSASKGLNLFGNTASRVSKKTFSLASAIGKVYATYFLLFRAFGKIRDSINISSQLKEVQNVVDTTFGDMTDKVEEFAQSSIKNFGLSELSAKQYSSRFQAMGVAMGITSAQVTKAQESLNAINPTLASRGYNDLANSMADVSINVTKLAADMASFYNVSQEDVAKDLEAIYTGMTRPLRKYGLDLTEATLKEWAMKNGLDANIKSMTQAEKTMLRYQYVMANTSASQGDFAKTSAKHNWRVA